MNYDRIFRVDFPNGFLEVNVGKFFGEMPLRNIKKFLRLAAQNCTHNQKLELIDSISCEDQRRVEYLEQLSEIKAEWCDTASKAMGMKVNFADSAPKKALERQRAKLAKSRELIEEVWPD